MGRRMGFASSKAIFGMMVQPGLSATQWKKSQAGVAFCTKSPHLDIRQTCCNQTADISCSLPCMQPSRAHGRS